MADKYISHGNTYDGDGSTSAAAASAGATGAWNDLTAILTAVPTYGTIAAGDVVNIRTQISSTDVTVTVVNGADQTVLHRGDRDDGPITWFADDGTIWSGDDGKLTIQVATNHSFIIEEYNYFRGIDQNIEILSTVAGTSSHDHFIEYHNHVVMHNCILKTHSSTTKYNNQYINSWSRVIFIDCLLWERAWYVSSFVYMQSSNYGAAAYFYNCEFKTDLSSVTDPMIYIQGIAGHVIIIGGKTTGMSTSRTLLGTATNYNGLHKVTVVGFDCDCIIQKEMDEDALYLGTCMFSDCDDSEVFDLFIHNTKGTTKWIRGDSFPYLNATLPDTTPYSLRYRQRSSTSVYVASPYLAADLSKYFDEASATRKITLEILIDSSLTSPMNAEYVMEVGYLSTDDEYKVDHTTIDWLSTISTSTAAWNTTTYKTRTHTKYKLELTTASQIKQYSNVTVRLKVGKSQSTNYYSFIDPDFTIGAP